MVELTNHDVKEKVKAILTQCIDNLTNFQEHVTLLRRFFNDIHNRISVIDQTHVANFLDSADRLANINTSDQEALEERRTYYLEVCSDISCTCYGFARQCLKSLRNSRFADFYFRKYNKMHARYERATQSSVNCPEHIFRSQKSTFYQA